MKEVFLRLAAVFRCLITLALLMPMACFAQTYAEKKFTVADGLPGSFTYRAYPDHEGYLWIATTAGLSRFDGKQFVNYGLSDGLLSLKVDGLLEDSRGRFWVGSNAGMAEFRNNRFVYFPVADSVTIFGVADFTELHDGRILACTSAGIYQFSDSFWKPVTLFPGYDHRRCRNVLETADGGLYVRYDHEIVYRDPLGEWSKLDVPPGNNSISNRIVLCGNGLIASIDQHLYRIFGSQCFRIDEKDGPGKNIYSFTLDSQGRLWTGGEDFLNISLPGSWSRRADSLSASQVYYLCADSSHNVWAATSNGLIRFRDLGAVPVSGLDKARQAAIKGVAPLGGGRLLIWRDNGLSVYDHDRFSPVTLPPGSGDILRIVPAAGKNACIVFSQKGMLQLEGTTLHKLAGLSYATTINEVYDARPGPSRGGYWVCTDSTLLYQDSSGLRKFIPRNTGRAVEKPIRAWETKNGLVLVYVDGQGVFGITAGDEMVSLIGQTEIDGRHKGINQHDVYFYEDRSGSFWIAFPGLGLFEYEFGRSKIPFLRRRYVAATDGLQSDKIISLAVDSAGRVWVESDAGIDILKKDSLGNRVLYNYACESDLRVNLNDFSQLVSKPGEDQVLLFTPGGVIRFESGSLRLAKEPPRTVIEKVLLNFKEAQWRDAGDSVSSYFDIPVNAVLSYQQNSLTIFFNAIDFGAPAPDPEWSYRLLPLDTSWSTPTRVRSVSFARLPSGKYIFEVRSRDKASGWGGSSILQFLVTPPFWATWWFGVLFGCLVCGLVLVVIRSREKRIHQRAFVAGQLKDLEMKALKAQIKPHFIYNSLNSIQALVVSGKKEESLRYIGSFSRLLRQVLDYTESNTISLDKELETLQLYIQLETLRLDMELCFREELDEELVSEFEKIPPLILQPFVENALWHGLSRKEGLKEIILSAKIAGDWLICEVKDNGIGRAAAMTWKMNSLPIHLSRALEITRKRLIDFNGDSGFDPITFVDHIDDGGSPLGTSVFLSISRKPPRGY